jgi:hypothetical protein
MEERLKLNSKFLLTLAAAVPAALMPLAVAGQVAPERPVAPRSTTPSYKYEAYVGFAYSPINQVNQSRYGLYGGKAAFTREFGKYFGLTANGDYYKYATSSGNPGDPSVVSITAGPEFRATLMGNVDGFFHILLGGEHTGGEGMTPDVSFSSGLGGGLVYNTSRRWGIRLEGDRQSDSFTFSDNTAQLGNSPHTHWNGRASIGVVGRF